MKKSPHNISENPTRQAYKKSYLVRVLEDKEASKEIERCINYERQDDEQASTDIHPNRPT